MNDARVAFDHIIDERFESGQVKVVLQNLVARLSHQQRIIHGSVVAEQRLRLLLELLRGDLLGADASRNYQTASSNLAEAFGEQLGVEQMGFNQAPVVIGGEQMRERLRFNLM